MKRAATDTQLSVASSEFLWSEAGLGEVHRDILPVIVRWLREASAECVLDIGCGNGALTHELAKVGLSTVGIDHSSSGITLARRSYPQHQFEQHDVGAPLPGHLTHCFAAVTAVEVVEHLLLPRHLLQRAKEALRAGGLFILTTPYHGFLKNLALALTNRFDEHWHPLRDYGHVKFFSRSTLRRLFEEQGFTVTKLLRVGRCPPMAKSMIVEGRLGSAGRPPALSADDRAR